MDDDEDFEEEGRAGGWRTLIAAVFAIGVVGAVFWAGFGLLNGAVDEERPDAASAVARFETAVNDGLDEGLRETAAGDPAEFFATLDGALAPLSALDVTVSAGQLETSGSAGSVPITWTLAGGGADGASWESSLDLLRRRGAWQPVLASTTVHPDLLPDWTFDLEVSGAVRAPILGFDGTPLTTDVGVRLGIEPGRLRGEERLLGAWAANLPDSYQELEDLLAQDDLRPTWFYPVVTISATRYEEVRLEFRGIPGFIARESDNANADVDFALHILGRVDEPTAEMIDNGAVEGIPVGLYGLQRVFEDQLVGGDSARLIVRESDGDVHGLVSDLSQDAASEVTTTLDAVVQQAVEDALLGRDDNAAVVVVSTADAAILASASRPLTGYNRAFEGRYTPGDSVLPVALDALVAAGVSMGGAVECPAEATVLGAQMSAPRPLGSATVAEALGQGCDTTLGELASRLDLGDLVAAAGRAGFGREFDLPIATSVSSWPDPLDATEAARSATGQGQVLATPLHVATVLAAASSGTWRPPYLLVNDKTSESASPLSTGTGGAWAEVLREGVPVGGVPSIVGTASRQENGGRVIDAWSMTVTNNLAIVVLVEGAGDETAAREILERLLVELP